LSGEHVISVNAWPGANRAAKAKTPIKFRRGVVRSDGSLDTNVPRGFERSLTVNNLKAKVLCETHNNRLWSTDDEAGVLTNAIAGFWDMWHKRWIPGLRYNRKEFHIDGPTIERWFIKTVLANIVGDGLPIGSVEAEPGTPTDELVNIAFGMAELSGHIGLYGAAAIDGNFDEQNEFAFAFMPWHWFENAEPSHTYVAGALCFYRGLRFVLSLDRSHPPPIGMLQRQPGWAGFQLLHPLKVIEAPAQGLYICFDWPSTPAVAVDDRRAGPPGTEAA